MTPSVLDQKRARSGVRWALVLAFGFLVLLTLSPSPAAAASIPHVAARLEYLLKPASLSCPPASELRGEVMRRMGYDPFLAEDPSFRVVATIRASGRALRADVDIYDKKGAKRIGKSFQPANVPCRVLVEGMAIAIAFHLDTAIFPDLTQPPTLSVEPPPSSPPPPAPSLPRVVPPSLVAKSDDGSAKRDEGAAKSIDPKTGIGFDSHMAFGASDPTFGMTGLLEFRWPITSLALEFRFDPSSATSAETRGKPATVYTLLTGASVVPCLHGDYVFGCGMISTGFVFGSATDLDRTSSTAIAYLGSGLRVGLEKNLGSRLIVRLYGEGLTALRMSRGILVEGSVVQGPALVSLPVTGSLGTGLLTQF